MKKEIIEISIPNLDLDQENARFENNFVSSQREAISLLLALPGMLQKISNMIKHISEYGVDPTELPLIIPSNYDDKKYIVVEGNRRVLCLKLLKNPNLCPENLTSLKKVLNEVRNTQIQPIPQKIQCSLVENRETANLWIELKHTGENEGSGRVGWDGRATDAFREKVGGGKSIGRIILDYIANDQGFNADLRKYASQIKITNLNRLFGSADVSSKLGYKIENKRLKLAVSIPQFRKSLEAIIERFQEDNLTVRDIYTKEHRKDFIDKRIDQADLPSSKNIKNEYVYVEDIKKEEQLKENPEAIQAPTKKARSIPKSNLRKRLINFNLRIQQDRINNIYYELREKIDVHETPNAASVLFRVFFELSTDHALENGLGPKNINSNAKLREKVTAVIDQMLVKNILHKKEAQDLKNAANNKIFELGTIDGIHRYIHGKKHPIPTELNEIMDNWKKYFELLWSFAQRDEK